MGQDTLYKGDPLDEWVFFDADRGKVETLLEPVMEENPDAHKLGFTSIRLERDEDTARIREAVIHDGVYSANPFKPLFVMDPGDGLLERYGVDPERDVAAVNLGAYRERRHNLEHTYKGYRDTGFLERVAAALEEPAPILTEDDLSTPQQVPA